VQLLTGTAQALPKPLRLHPAAKPAFFVPREPWSPLSLLKSPMVLMMLFSAAMAFGMPKLLANVDPEILEEMKHSNPQQLLSNMQTELGSGSSSQQQQQAAVQGSQPSRKERHRK